MLLKLHEVPGIMLEIIRSEKTGAELKAARKHTAQWDCRGAESSSELPSCRPL